MDKKEKEEKIKKLSNKATKLTKVLFKEQKSNMYNKIMELLKQISKKIEALRKLE